MAGPITTPMPVVRYRGIGYAHVIAQVRTPAGWRLRLTWPERYADDPAQWRWEVSEVDPSDVTQLDGQDYGSVPREHRAAPPEEKTKQQESWRYMGKRK
jgi:hypothetical protein